MLNSIDDHQRLAGAVRTPRGSSQECRLGGKVVAGSEKGRGFMSRFYHRVDLNGDDCGLEEGDEYDDSSLMSVKLVKLSQVSVTTDWAMTVIREDKERDQRKQTPRRRSG